MNREGQRASGALNGRRNDWKTDKANRLGEETEIRSDEQVPTVDCHRLLPEMGRRHGSRRGQQYVHVAEDRPHLVAPPGAELLRLDVPRGRQQRTCS